MKWFVQGNSEIELKIKRNATERCESANNTS